MGNWLSKHAQQSRFLKDMPLDKDMTGSGGPHTEKDPLGKDFKSDMGEHEPTITAYEGEAFVGTPGGGGEKAAGDSAQGFTQSRGTNTPDNSLFRGKVISRGSQKKDKSTKRVKGGVYSS